MPKKEVKEDVDVNEQRELAHRQARKEAEASQPSVVRPSKVGA